VEKLIATSDDGAKLWQTGAAPHGKIELAMGYIEIDGGRLGSSDSLIGSLLMHCPTPWVPVSDGRGRRPIDIVLRGSIVGSGVYLKRKGRRIASARGLLR
jgi:hypothetical protein